MSARLRAVLRLVLLLLGVVLPGCRPDEGSFHLPQPDLGPPGGAPHAGAGSGDDGPDPDRACESTPDEVADTDPFCEACACTGVELEDLDWVADQLPPLQGLDDDALSLLSKLRESRNTVASLYWTAQPRDRLRWAQAALQRLQAAAKNQDPGLARDAATTIQTLREHVDAIHKSRGRFDRLTRRFEADVYNVESQLLRRYDRDWSADYREYLLGILNPDSDSLSGGAYAKFRIDTFEREIGRRRFPLVYGTRLMLMDPEQARADYRKETQYLRIWDGPKVERVFERGELASDELGAFPYYRNGPGFDPTKVDRYKLLLGAHAPRKSVAFAIFAYASLVTREMDLTMGRLRAIIGAVALLDPRAGSYPTLGGVPAALTYFHPRQLFELFHASQAWRDALALYRRGADEAWDAAVKLGPGTRRPYTFSEGGASIAMGDVTVEAGQAPEGVVASQDEADVMRVFLAHLQSVLYQTVTVVDCDVDPIKVLPCYIDLGVLSEAGLLFGADEQRNLWNAYSAEASRHFTETARRIVSWDEYAQGLYRLKKSIADGLLPKLDTLVEEEGCAVRDRLHALIHKGLREHRIGAYAHAAYQRFGWNLLHGAGQMAAALDLAARPPADVVFTQAEQVFFRDLKAGVATLRAEILALNTYEDARRFLDRAHVDQRFQKIMDDAAGANSEVGQYVRDQLRTAGQLSTGIRLAAGVGVGLALMPFTGGLSLPAAILVGVGTGVTTEVVLTALDNPDASLKEAAIRGLVSSAIQIPVAIGVSSLVWKSGESTFMAFLKTGGLLLVENVTVGAASGGLLYLVHAGIDGEPITGEGFFTSMALGAATGVFTFGGHLGWRFGRKISLQSRPVDVAGFTTVARKLGLDLNEPRFTNAQGQIVWEAVYAAAQARLGSAAGRAAVLKGMDVPTKRAFAHFVDRYGPVLVPPRPLKAIEKQRALIEEYLTAGSLADFLAARRQRKNTPPLPDHADYLDIWKNNRAVPELRYSRFRVMDVFDDEGVVIERVADRAAAVNQAIPNALLPDRPRLTAQQLLDLMDAQVKAAKAEFAQSVERGLTRLVEKDFTDQLGVQWNPNDAQFRAWLYSTREAKGIIPVLIDGLPQPLTELDVAAIFRFAASKGARSEGSRRYFFDPITGDYVPSKLDFGVAGSPFVVLLRSRMDGPRRVRPGWDHPKPFADVVSRESPSVRPFTEEVFRTYVEELTHAGIHYAGQDGYLLRSRPLADYILANRDKPGWLEQNANWLSNVAEVDICYKAYLDGEQVPHHRVFNSGYGQRVVFFRDVLPNVRELQLRPGVTEAEPMGDFYLPNSVFTDEQIRRRIDFIEKANYFKRNFDDPLPPLE